MKRIRQKGRTFRNCGRLFKRPPVIGILLSAIWPRTVPSLPLICCRLTVHKNHYLRLVPASKNPERTIILAVDSYRHWSLGSAAERNRKRLDTLHRRAKDAGAYVVFKLTRKIR